MSCGSNECTGYAVAVGMTGVSVGRPVLGLRMNGDGGSGKLMTGGYALWTKAFWCRVYVRML